jgi:hypothetical protein
MARDHHAPDGDRLLIHDPRNLAPICSSCNGPGGKGGDDLSDLPVVLSKLKQAVNLRSKVIKKAQTFRNPGKTAAALILAREAVGAHVIRVRGGT